MVHEPALDHVDELVVAAGIGWKKEETRVNKIAERVEHNPLHHFTVEELKAHPDAVNRWGAIVEVQVLVFRAALEAVDIENRLDILDGHLFDSIGIETANPEGFGGTWRSFAQ
jgi:hypothetical protein